MASSPVQPPFTTTELQALAMSEQENFVPAAEELRPHTFLSLAPKTSASYPTKRAELSPRLDGNLATSMVNTEAEAKVEDDLKKELRAERSESVSSQGSTGSGVGAQRLSMRFLKLGPVHFGEGDGKGDWSEEVVAE